MSHPCKSDFWGTGADLLLQWLDDLDGQLGQPAPLPSQSVCHLTQEHSESLRALHIAISEAAGIVATTPQLCTHDVVFDPGAEAEFRQLTQVLIALLVADHYDSSRPEHHDPVAQAGWMWTPGNSGNPDQFDMERLVGPSGAPPNLQNLTVDSKSLLGRIRNSLGA